MKEDNTQYFNDEWNQPSKPGSESYKIEILDMSNNKIYTLEEYKKLAEKEFNSKNNKPDGRRYKK